VELTEIMEHPFSNHISSSRSIRLSLHRLSESLPCPQVGQSTLIRRQDSLTITTRMMAGLHGIDLDRTQKFSKRTSNTKMKLKCHRIQWTTLRATPSREMNPCRMAAMVEMKSSNKSNLHLNLTATLATETHSM
jgi:hypothetical protein